MSRWLHRDLSYLFAGALLVYAISGICLNHKRDFNSDYSIRLTEYTLENPLPAEKDGWDKDYVLGLLEPLGERENYTQHYFPDGHTVKVFLKGGSSLQADIRSGRPGTSPCENVRFSRRSIVCITTRRAPGRSFPMCLPGRCW